MANEEQLKILKQGVEVWNAWRKKNPYEERPRRVISMPDVVKRIVQAMIMNPECFFLLR